MNNLPTSGKEWSQIARHLPSERTRTINRFTARLRVAHLFGGLKLNELSPETVRGYEAMFSVFLSYTAFELFWAGLAEYYEDVSIENEKYEFELSDSGLGEKLKSNKKLEHFLLHEKLSNDLLRGTNDFFGGHESNLMPILAGIRHKVTHGHLSVAGINADTKGNSQAIWDASQLLIEATDDLFSSFVCSLD
jgi:hypothetical protein